MIRYLFLALIFCYRLTAHEPYHAKVTVDIDSKTVAAPNLVDLTRRLKESSLELLIPLYTPTTPVSIGINLRGILAQTSFAANSTTLVVDIPQADYTDSFTGATRDESLKLLREAIRNGGNKQKLFKAYRRFSPIDPIAGNPNSLLAEIGQADYNLGKLYPEAGCSCSSTIQPTVHLFQASLDVSRGFSKGFDTTAVAFPFRYSYSPTDRWAFIIDAPMTYLRNGGASSIAGSIGVGFQWQVTDHWFLTPVARLGSSGSLDLCTGGNFASAGLVSRFDFPISQFVLSLTDYVGYSATTNFWLTGINFDYHFQTFQFKNGLSLTSCEGFCLCEREVKYSVYVIDTAFSKSHLYMNHYDEVGASLFATGINPCLDYDCLTLALSYLFGEKNYKGIRFNLGYQF
jgi:hypothetical protein